MHCVFEFTTEEGGGLRLERDRPAVDIQASAGETLRVQHEGDGAIAAYRRLKDGTLAFIACVPSIAQTRPVYYRDERGHNHVWAIREQKGAKPGNADETVALAYSEVIADKVVKALNERVW